MQVLVRLDDGGDLESLRIIVKVDPTDDGAEMVVLWMLRNAGVLHASWPESDDFMYGRRDKPPSGRVLVLSLQPPVGTHVGDSVRMQVGT